MAVLRLLSGLCTAPLLVLLVSSCASLAPPAPPAPPPSPQAPIEHLLHQLHAETRLRLYAAAGIDPRSRQEDRAAVARRRQRQQELSDWYHQAGRPTSRSQLSEADQQRLREYPQLMASAALLELSRSQRLAYLDRVDHTFYRLQRHAQAALEKLCAGDAELIAEIEARAREIPSVQLRYFGRGPQTTVGAIYQPGTRTIYLNLNHSVHEPNAFFDAFEHELWHHLLPIVSTQSMGQRPWVEGYVEAVAELWGGAVSSPYPSVEYPVQTALATLHLAHARRPTLRYLTGLDDEATFRAQLEPRLPGLFPDLHVPGSPQDLRDLLRAWGWEEDDGSPLRLEHLLTDTQLSPSAVSQEFLQDGAFVMDLIRAISILKLQAAQPLPPLPQDLPQPLRDNLQRVLRHIDAPHDYLR